MTRYTLIRGNPAPGEITTVYVEAETPEEAMKLAAEQLKDRPYAHEFLDPQLTMCVPSDLSEEEKATTNVDQTPKYQLQLLRCDCPAKRKILALDRVVGGEPVDSITVTFACCGVYEIVPHSVAKPSRWAITEETVVRMLMFMRGVEM